MAMRKNPYTVGGRVNEKQLARLDAAARLNQQPRAHFIIQAALDRAEDVLRRAVGDQANEPAEVGR